MSAAGSDSDAETVITEGTIERGKGSTEKETVGKVSQLTSRSSQLNELWRQSRLKRSYISIN